MSFVVSYQNVFDYLCAQHLCTLQPKPSQIKPKLCKNFNLLVSFPNDRHLLVKQVLQDEDTSSGFINEWLIHKFLLAFPEVNHIQSLISELLHYHSSHSIIVFNYLNNYCDLTDFYTKQQIFPAAIAAAIGASLATIHRTTFNRQEYKEFFAQHSEDSADDIPNFSRGLERLEPEIFGLVSLENLKFFELYQRYESLGQAIAQLNDTFEPCCLTHNDLKLNNILLHNNWQHVAQGEPSADSIVRLIDWENCAWGDPAYDLGTIIANYLKIWLDSLVISTAIDVETALRLAITPLEELQPSIVALTQAYFSNFPEILQQRTDFFKRVVQYVGFGLIEKIQARIQYQEPFGNTGICMLQVAKTLLCHPEQSVLTVFGKPESELTCYSHLCI